MSFLFVTQMAWRDSRASRRRLILFSISISIGIGALVAIDSFRVSLARAIDLQARTLLGADLVVATSRQFSPDENAFFAGMGPRQARETRFTSMAVFPRAAGTRLVQVRALQGEFPMHGTLETEPAIAARILPQGGRAVVDQSLLLQFGTRVGDRIRIGDSEFEVAGALVRVPGDASAGAGFAPRVFISERDVAATNLIKPGSIVRYLAYIGFAAEENAERRAAELAPQLQGMGFEVDTVAERKRVLGRALENLYRFLNLVGFISLLLGALGVASGIHGHLQQKVRTNAILRCLGAGRGAATSVYLMQVAAMGLVGALFGAALGTIAQRLLPIALQSFLPFPIPSTISWLPLWRGSAIGFVCCLLFALPPLLRLRRVSPLLILRGPSDQPGPSPWRDPLLWTAYLLISAGVTAFSVSQAETSRQGLIFAAGLAVVVGLFAASGKLLMLIVRRWFPHQAAFVLRQGLANLYRPNNRTLLLTTALGFATFLLLDLQLTRDVLLAQFRSIGAGNQPNIFLFDIQLDQKEPVAALVSSLGFPVLQQAPIVTMRLAAIKGQPVSEILADAKRTIPEWQLEREYRSTFREDISETEKITAGAWIGRVDYKPGDVVPISLDRELARDWQAEVSDEIVFDVQGIPIRARIASLREIDWKRFQTNFFVVFPAGVLENAPGFHVLVSRTANPAGSARLQNAVVAKYPNVSAIDLAAVIQTVDSILGKAALAIRVVSLFTVVAGLVVVVSAIWSGRYQRVEESVLLRTLGATRRQIWSILAAEYVFLGLFASLLGVGLSLLASWALAAFVFKLAYAPSLIAVAIAAVAATSLTVVIGLLASRGVSRTPPLQVLRAESY